MVSLRLAKREEIAGSDPGGSGLGSLPPSSLGTFKLEIKKELYYHGGHFVSYWNSMRNSSIMHLSSASKPGGGPGLYVGELGTLCELCNKYKLLLWGKCGYFVPGKATEREEIAGADPGERVDRVASHPPLCGHLSLKLRERTLLSRRQLCLRLFWYFYVRSGTPRSNIVDPPLKSGASCVFARLMKRSENPSVIFFCAWNQTSVKYL